MSGTRKALHDFLWHCQRLVFAKNWMWLVVKLFWCVFNDIYFQNDNLWVNQINHKQSLDSYFVYIFQFVMYFKGFSISGWYKNMSLTPGSLLSNTYLSMLKEKLGITNFLLPKEQQCKRKSAEYYPQTLNQNRWRIGQWIVMSIKLCCLNREGSLWYILTYIQIVFKKHWNVNCFCRLSPGCW